MPGVALAVYMVMRDRVVPVAGAAAGAAVDMHPCFQTPLAKLGLLFTSTLMTRTGIDVGIGIALWFLVGAGVVATVRAHRAGAPGAGQQVAGHRRALLAGMVAVALLFAALPNSVGWFAFVDGRLVPLLPLLGLLTVDGAAFGPRLRIAWSRASALLAVGIVSLCLVASYLFQAEAAGYQEVLRSVPPQRRLLNLPLQPNSTIFAGHPFVHTDKLALVDKPTVVSDVWFHPGSAIYPTRDNPALRLQATYSESNLKVIDWPAYRLEDWDYVLIRTRPDAGAPPIPSGLRLAIHRGGWWLYRTTAG